jgi:hypothetical protein
MRIEEDSLAREIDSLRRVLYIKSAIASALIEFVQYVVTMLDPLSAPALTLGAVGLAMQLFEGIKVGQFSRQAVDWRSDGAKLK